ncbi:MAG TPA: type I polyketide synthase, partial [Roseiflexaceae bacterium]|nr:type I polyketide synthase [Roseiflexaceae bacterium]
MNTPIAIVGMACRYPDADSPQALWENGLAQRQAFRRIPDERLRLADYHDSDPHAPDRTYATEAALIEGYRFDRLRFRLAGSTVRSADLTHWLALDAAAQALADAGFPEGQGLPRESTGALVGNTLTGEFSRAGLMRLRWPYVRRAVGATLGRAGWPAGECSAFLDKLEETYKRPFPEVGEETLAGGLSNTIAGRICNVFDLKGGGFTVDGACASSLLAVANACSTLLAGDLDVALAGGVDLSLDPFELVGFAKTGALACEQMRVYDARSAGFWPGEGCGFVVLMRHTDALRQGRRVYALIQGWGISSDGSGGITRPEVAGQLLAVQRAYRRAGFGVETVGYFEGHGTGTSVGDTTELRMLAQARRAGGATTPAVISSIKANIGHTKAAAGVAGLIRAALALDAQILPPLAGRAEPHPELCRPDAALRTLAAGALWPADLPLRAGVSAMGFGGINVHLALEGTSAVRRAVLGPREQGLLAAAQDAELLLLSAPDCAALDEQAAALETRAAHLSRAELTDLAAQLAAVEPGPVRAALVVTRPADLVQGLATLRGWLAEGLRTWLDPRAGLFLASGATEPRIGLLFPGQGAPTYRDGGMLRRRFPAVEEIYAQAALPAGGDGVDTAVAQPAIAAAELAGLRALRACGVDGTLAVGHSLGELTALAWAGALGEAGLLRIARERGLAMGRLNGVPGAMASIEAGQREVAWLLSGTRACIACLNGPRRTVVSGPATDVEAVVTLAQARGLATTLLPVSHAFHSPLVAAAATKLEACLRNERFGMLQRPVISTVTGRLLESDADLAVLLRDQIAAPVRFSAALAAADDIDLWIEIGPGRMLSALAAEQQGAPVVATDAGGESLAGLLRALGAAFVLGAPLDRAALFAGRLIRPLDLERAPCFFASPCEQVSDSEGEHAPLAGPTPARQPAIAPPALSAAATPDRPHPSRDALAIVCQLVAGRLEMPLEAVRPGDRLLSDLHLNSIAVGQLVVEAARQLHIAPPVATTEYADATVEAMAQALVRRSEMGEQPQPETQPAGIGNWVRAFMSELVAQTRPARPAQLPLADWQMLVPDNHPLAGALRAAFEGAPGGRGVVVALPSEPALEDATLLLEGAKQALRSGAPLCFVLVQQQGGGAAVARTLALEAADVMVVVVNLPFQAPSEADWVLDEALAAAGRYTEVCYDEQGRRFTPVLRPLAPAAASQPLPLGPDDVVLVSGGGKGITAECALALARASGAALALLGRSAPPQDAELATNLQRMRAAGVRCCYISADISDPEAAERAVREAETALGPVTALLHGAARNTPCLLGSLSAGDLAATLAPKVGGLHHLLAALDPQRLRLLVSFGSIIACSGLPG